MLQDSEINETINSTLRHVQKIQARHSVVAKNKKKKNILDQDTNLPNNYFQNILKQQRKKMHVKNFVKKIKQSIVRRDTVDHSSLQTEQKIFKNQEIKGIKICYILNLILTILGILHIITLIFLGTLGLVFQSVSSSNIVFGIQTCNLLYHIIEMVLNCISIKEKQGIKIEKISEIIKDYLKSTFTMDLIILIILILDVGNILTIQYLKITYLIKLFSFDSKLHTIELFFINSQHKQLCWSLIKVCISNFSFAHLLAILLVGMSLANKEKSWMVYKNIYTLDWYQQYIWAYYWGTTIMISVGFGDLAAHSTREALCLTFIQIFSCFVLSYNFNCIGTIIAKIKSYDVQKEKKGKIFSKMCESGKISQDLNHKIYNFIRQESAIKRNFQLQEQEQFLKNLPQNFKDDLLKQTNKNLFTDLKFFRNISQRVIDELAIKIVRKLAHPDELIYEKSKDIQAIILSHGQYALTVRRPSHMCHGKIIQNLSVNQKENKILSLDFLFYQSLPFDVKSLDYSLIYQMSKEQFIKCLSNSNYDYQYYRMIYDKNRFILNQMEVWDCQLCPNQKHTLFKCPKLHYIPLSMHIIDKYIEKQQKNHGRLQRIKQFQRKKKKEFCALTDQIIVKRTIMHRRVRKMEDLIQQSLYAQLSNSLNRKSKKTLNLQFNNALKICRQATQHIKQELCAFMNQKNEGVWILEEFQVAHNYKYYFTNDNSQRLKYYQIKKMSDVLLTAVDTRFMGQKIALK